MKSSEIRKELKKRAVKVKSNTSKEELVKQLCEEIMKNGNNNNNNQTFHHKKENKENKENKEKNKMAIFGLHSFTFLFVFYFALRIKSI